MTILTTPDDRFTALPGFPFKPNYVKLQLSGALPPLRIHYVEEGPPDAAAVFLCLHGQPSWSYLYRKMIPVFAAAGQRVIAPDLIGFGRSDKPSDESVYTFSFHRQILIAFIEALDLKNVTLVCQDWGELLGLTLPIAMPERFSRLLVMNTALATGDVPLGEGFLAWRAFSSANPDLDIQALMKRSSPVISDAEAAAYAAPFPDASYKAGVRRFPNLVPSSPEEDGAAISREARHWFSTKWTGQSFMAIGMKDPVLGPPAMYALSRVIKGCPPPMEVAEAGHFVQEWGEPIARAALASFELRAHKSP